MEYLRIEFDLSEPPSTGTIERLFDGALDAGCFTSWGGGADQCRYSAPTTNHESRQADTESAIADIADAEDGRMTLFYGEYDDDLSPMDFTVSVFLDTGDPSNVDGTPQVLLSVDSVYLDSLDAPAPSVEARSNDLRTLVKEFYSILHPFTSSVAEFGPRVSASRPG